MGMGNRSDLALSAEQSCELVAKLEANVGSVLLGKPETIRLAVVALLAEGHLLIEDVPGVGKTLLARALAKSIGGVFRRIQFTPDLLPSDMLGTNIFNSQRSSFEFKPGPIFANVVLADEINRTTPRSQSALLEAMNARQVTIGGRSYRLERPFVVLATQNPFEFEGTYPLPESQLDRFMMRIRVGYPGRSDELELLERQAEYCNRDPVEQLEPVLSTHDVVAMQNAVRQVRVDRSLAEYLMDIVESSRRCPELYVGASPRAAISLYRAAQALAFASGRDYVLPDDIKYLAVAVLAHRVIGKAALRDGQPGETDRIVAELVDAVAVPE